MIDPICGMEVEPNTAAGKQEHNGQTYLFCSPHCLETFKKDPARFLKPQAHEHADRAHDHDHAHVSPEKTDQAEHVAYVCPMDPEVRESKPGACPKCGMALEPASPSVPVVKTEYV